MWKLLHNIHLKVMVTISTFPSLWSKLFLSSLKEFPMSMRRWKEGPYWCLWSHPLGGSLLWLHCMWYKPWFHLLLSFIPSQDPVQPSFRAGHLCCSQASLADYLQYSGSFFLMSPSASSLLLRGSASLSPKGQETKPTQIWVYPSSVSSQVQHNEVGNVCPWSPCISSPAGAISPSFIKSFPASHEYCCHRTLVSSQREESVQ